MKDTSFKLPQNPHHAYIIEGGVDVKEQLLQNIKDTLGIEVRGNPDVHIRECNVFGIDDSRILQSLESKKAVTLDKKIFVLHINSITRKAQNALLKTFEEPTAGTHFFIVIPSIDGLLKTLLSRVHIVREVREGKKEISLLAKQFLSSAPSERLALVDDIIESKNKQEALQLVNDLEIGLYKINDFSGEGESVPTEAFETIFSVRSYLNDSSSSVKILLGHLSVTLPKTT